MGGGTILEGRRCTGSRGAVSEVAPWPRSRTRPLCPYRGRTAMPTGGRREDFESHPPPPRRRRLTRSVGTGSRARCSRRGATGRAQGSPAARRFVSFASCPTSSAPSRERGRSRRSGSRSRDVSEAVRGHGIAAASGHGRSFGSREATKLTSRAEPRSASARR